jgi:hypothetical protein
LGPSSSLTRSLPPLDQPRSPLPASVAFPRCLAPHSLPASIASRLSPHSPAAPIRSPGQTVPAARLAPHSLRPAECRGWSCRSQRAPRALLQKSAASHPIHCPPRSPLPARPDPLPPPASHPIHCPPDRLSRPASHPIHCPPRSPLPARPDRSRGPPRTPFTARPIASPVIRSS